MVSGLLLQADLRRPMQVRGGLGHNYVGDAHIHIEGLGDAGDLQVGLDDALLLVS